MADREFLVGDIGGTNARFALACPDGTLEDVRVLAVAEHENFDRALEAYLSSLNRKPVGLCIASAGALQGERVHLTNADWHLDAKDLGTQFGFPAVKLINDFEAQARFAGSMAPSQGHVLKAGTPIEGAPVLTIGPGTGFGQALFVPGTPPKIVATEGGHRLLPVRTERELRLCETLTAEMEHPAILEYVLSGKGICHLYDAVLREANAAPDPCDPPAVTEAALAGPGHARDAMLWFLDYLAVAAADACVMTGARGGVAISGGITPRLLSLFDEIDFGERFARAGILQDYLSEVPVTLVTDPYAALYGAATLMRDHLGIR